MGGSIGQGPACNWGDLSCVKSTSNFFSNIFLSAAVLVTSGNTLAQMKHLCNYICFLVLCCWQHVFTLAWWWRGFFCFLPRALNGHCTIPLILAILLNCASSYEWCVPKCHVTMYYVYNVWRWILDTPWQLAKFLFATFRLFSDNLLQAVVVWLYNSLPLPIFGALWFLYVWDLKQPREKERTMKVSKTLVLT